MFARQIKAKKEGRTLADIKKPKSAKGTASGKPSADKAPASDQPQSDKPATKTPTGPTATAKPAAADITKPHRNLYSLVPRMEALEKDVRELKADETLNRVRAGYANVAKSSTHCEMPRPRVNLIQRRRRTPSAARLGIATPHTTPARFARWNRCHASPRRCRSTTRGQSKKPNLKAT